MYALAESPRTAGIIWAGTDDGKIWVTGDAGATWTDLTASLPSAAQGQWIANLEAGHADDNVGYVVVSAYRAGNYAPLVYRTADRGRTWQSVAGNLPGSWPARVIREDPNNPNLLFAGTEIGLFASFDRGTTWLPLGGLPPVPVDDIRIHPATHDLVIATHGRSLYVMDDIAPLEQLTPDVQSRDAYLFPVAPAHGFEPLPGWDWAGTSGIYRGANPPVGAVFTLWLKQFTGETVSMTVKNASGQPVATLSAPGVPGLSRLVWNLKPTADVLSDYGGGGASKFVAPGDYQVTLAVGAVKTTQSFPVTIAPGLETR